MTHTMSQIPIQQIPLTVLFAVSVGTVLVSIAIGYRLGKARRNKQGGLSEGPVGSVVGAVLGLLAFMLAFTFGISSGRFESRKQLLLDDVNAISTAFDRADLITEPFRGRCRDYLRRYVDLRVQASVNQGASLGEAILETDALHEALWRDAAALARADMNSDIGALFVESINDLRAMHRSRLNVAIHYHISPVVWVALALLTVLGMTGVGYQFGMMACNNLTVHLILAASYSLVIILIADLDRSTTGLMSVNQQPMIELQARLAGDLTPPALP